MRGLPLTHARAMPQQKTARAAPPAWHAGGEDHLPAHPTQPASVHCHPFARDLSRNAHGNP